MLRFTVTVDVIADKWADEDEKKVFMGNAEDVIQKGLNLLTLPDWEVTVQDVEDINDKWWCGYVWWYEKLYYHKI